MSSGSQKLSEDYGQVKKLLASYPNIKIIKTEGDPPEKYDIQYNIKGYKSNPDGTASPDNRHEVRLTLPFGYPHFPPTAKPLTPIFHPDIDPDAIRIADFWQDNHSLPELIIHIGQMICGNYYTKEDPFNQSAFEWFEERKSWLPFDILEPGDEEIDSEAAEAVLAAEDTGGSKPKQVAATAKDLDILKDDIDFPFDDEEPGGEDEDFSLDLGLGEGESDNETPFDIEKELAADDLLALGAEEVGDEFSLDMEEDLTAESFDLEDDLTAEPVASEVSDDQDDLFRLEAEDLSDDISFDLADLPEDTVPPAEASGEDTLFDLEEEKAEAADKETPLEFDFDDLSSAFEEEDVSTSAKPENSDLTLDDHAGLEEEGDTLDFGIAEESEDIGGDMTVDLSGLEEETIEELAAAEEFEPATAEVDEDKILSALSLDQDFSSSDKAGEQSLAIRSLIDQKQIFAAKKVLSDHPDPETLPQKKELELTISGAISEAEDLYKKADKHEQKGEFEKAGILLDLVANIATDYPGLEMARNRIRESIMSDGKKKPSEKSAKELEGEASEEEKERPADKPVKKKKKAQAGLGFKVPARLIATLLIILLLGGIGGGVAYVYNNDGQHFQLAGIAFQKADQLVNSKEFKEAQKKLDTAIGELDKVLLFKGKEKDGLTAKIHELSGSSLFKEGLQGRVLYGDQYVSVETAKAIDKFTTHKAYAEQVLKSGKLDQAIPAYEKALSYAEKAGFEEEFQAITLQLKGLRLELALSQARESEEKLDWSGAEKAYTAALELSKEFSSPEEQKDIADRKATASYRHRLHEGMAAIKDSRWQESIDSLEEVNKILEANPRIIPDKEKSEIDKLLVQSHLYLALAEARKAFENMQWDEAITLYNEAIALLGKNSSLIGEEAGEDIRKIEKTILTTHVAREQKGVAESMAAKDLEQAVAHYQAITKLIGDSPFLDEETLAKILDDARTNTVEIKNQLLISKREKWLTDNYEKIFRDNYPSAKMSDLLNPKVRFVKREGNILVFNLRCTERKQGSTFRLELNYQNDLDKDSWSLYSGKIEAE